MLGGLLVRRLVEGEREAILQVTLAAYREYEAIMQPLHWKLYKQNIIATLAAPGPAEQFVALLEGQVVGTVLLYPEGSSPGGSESGRQGLRWPEVRLLAVAPQARDQGIGEALMARCIEHARSVGAEAIALHTNDMMVAAVHLYRRIGFERAPELDFSPVGEVVIKGYKFDLTRSDLQQGES